MLKVHERVGSPESRAQLLARDHLARMFDKDFEEAKRLFGKRDTRAVFPEVAGVEVQLEKAKACTTGQRVGSGHDATARMLAPASCHAS
jgi:hypothetical protein